MAIKNTAWHKVLPGQIVNFIYKTKGESKGYKRTVLIINPDLRYRKKSTGRIKRYVVGLILDTAITRPLTENKVEKLFGKLGGLKIEGDAITADMKDRITKNETTQLYRKLKNLVKQYNCYRTFDRRECMKRRVYLEVDYDGIPKDTLDDFDKEMQQKFSKMLEEE